MSEETVRETSPTTSSSSFVRTIGPEASDEDVVQFNNELNILRGALRNSGSVPRAVEREEAAAGPGGGRRRSFTLEDLSGYIPLRDWMRENPVAAFASEASEKSIEDETGTLSAGERERLLRAVLVMQRTASALTDVHEHGVSHNDIASDKIMVDVRCSAGGGKHLQDCDCEVKIIGFGMASISRGMETTDTGDTVNDDLYGLGKVFSAFLRPSEEEDGGNEEAEEDAYDANDVFNIGLGFGAGEDAANPAEQFHPLVPPALRKLVSDLLNVGRNVDEFASARDVADDLEQMLVFPEGFLFQSAAGNVGKVEVRSGRLFGRDAEIQTLLDAYGRVSGAANSSPSPEVVLVAGRSGTGKTALVDKLHALNEASANRENKQGGCRIIRGKFDQLSSAEPYSALVVAFSDLCDQILNEENEDDVSLLGERIMQVVGAPGVSALETILPKISRIVRGAETGAKRRRWSSLHAFGGGQQVNFQYIFQRFASAVFRPDRGGVVLFLDDLQWADAASLEVVKCLVTDPDDIRSLLFVGSYRSNCVDEDHVLMVQKREIEKKGVPVTTIDIGNLERKMANDLISYTLCVPKRLMPSLTDTIYAKTLGNPFFTLQFLSSLHDRGLLSFNTESRKWEWDIVGIKDMDMTDNVVELMRSKIVKLSSGEQHMLELAASVGTYIDVYLMQLISGARFDLTNGPQKSVEAQEDLLASVAKEGLIDEIDESRYKFAHDRIQEAAYELIPEKEREELHFRIGKKLWDNLSSTLLETYLFVVTNQLNKGAKMIHEENLAALATLNLRAGKKAMLSCAFANAVSYLETGIKLLKGTDQWEDEYDLSLDLHTICAEAQRCSGQFPEMERSLGEVFENARTLQDKLPAYCTLIKSLGGRDKLQEAIDTGFKVLAKLGEPFPKTMPKTTLFKDVFKAKLALRGKSNSDITDMPAMQDETKISAMKILGNIVLYVFWGSPTYLPSVASRMVRLSLKYGVNEASALGFVLFGWFMCNSLGDVEGGCRLGQIGLTILERFKGNDWTAAVNFIHYTFMDHWNESIDRSFEPFLSSGNIALRAGDMQYSTLSLHMFCCHGTGCGNQLDVLEDKSRAYNKIIVDYKQESCLRLHLPMWQTHLNLMGRSKNVLVLTGDAMDEEQFVARCNASNHVIGKMILFYYKEMLGYFFNDYFFAADFSEKGKDLMLYAGGGFMTNRKVFFDGLVAVAIAMASDSKKRKKWKRRSKKSMKLLRKWQCSPSCVHVLALLKAEHARLQGAASDAAAYYDTAIDLAKKIGFVHDEALANDKACEFHLEEGNNEEASKFAHRAHSLYLSWGARALAEHVEGKYAALLES